MKINDFFYLKLAVHKCHTIWVKQMHFLLQLSRVDNVVPIKSIKAALVEHEFYATF
jgi:hypothetical protein